MTAFGLYRVSVRLECFKKEEIMLYLFSSNEKSLFAELWEYFEETYFSPEIPYMENFTMGTGSLVTLKTILIGITFGLIFASFMTIYNKRYIGGFIRKLIKEECLDAERAKTLDELGYLKKIGVRRAIGSSGTLTRWVRCVEEDEFNAKQDAERIAFEEEHKNDAKPPKFKEIEFKRDTKTMRFYIPEEKKYAADVKFEAKGANWLSFAAVVVVSILLCAFLSYILPDIIKMVDNFISVTKS